MHLEFRLGWVYLAVPAVVVVIFFVMRGYVMISFGLFSLSAGRLRDWSQPVRRVLKWVVRYGAPSYSPVQGYAMGYDSVWVLIGGGLGIEVGSVGPFGFLYHQYERLCLLVPKIGKIAVHF